MRVYQFRHVGITKQQYNDTTGSIWCPRRDSNPHTSRHMDLNHARLPIPPRGHATHQYIDTTGSFWCPRRDSNPHTSRHMDLNHARLPIPPRGHTKQPFAMLASWCPRRDSNPHTSRHMDLNHARLPIPPRGHWTALLALLDVAVEFRYDIRLCRFALDQLSRSARRASPAQHAPFPAVPFPKRPKV
jgi:hypothetical protein